MKRAAGVISQEQFDNIIKDNQFYIPFVRVGKDGNEIVFGTGRLAAATNTGIRRMDKGVANAQIVDPFEQLIIDASETFHSVGKQGVSNAISEAVQAGGLDSVIRQIPANKIGRDYAGSPQLGKNQYALNVNGEKQYFEVADQGLADALESLSPATSNMAGRIMQGAKNILRFGVTTTPSFAAANVMRDALMTGMQQPFSRGLATSGAAGGAAIGALTAGEDDNVLGRAAAGAAAGVGGAHFGAHAARIVGALSDIMGSTGAGATLGALYNGITAGEDENEFMEFLKGGLVGAAGGGAMRLAGRGGNRDIYKQALRDGLGGGTLHQTNASAARLANRALKGKGSATNVLNPKTWYDAVEYLGNALEMAPRLAEYKRVLKEGGTRAEAVGRGRDITLDFSVRSGSKTLQQYSRVTAFANPAIQGYDKLARMLGNPQNLAMGVAMLTAPTIMLWSQIQSDPELAAAYNDIPMYERNAYWFVPNGEGGFNKIPKPFEIGALFASLPERVLEFTQQKSNEPIADVLMDLGTKYSPTHNIGLPTAVQPVVEAMTDHDFFRDRGVDPFPFDNLPAAFQSTPDQSSIAVAANKLPGLRDVSPARIDHVIKGITGTLGDSALRKTSQVARSVGWDDRAPAPTKNRALFGRFTHDTTRSGASEQRFRADYNEAEQTYNAVRSLYDQAQSTGDTSALREYVLENAEVLQSYYAMKSFKSQIDELTKARRQVRDMPADQIDDAGRRDVIAKLNAAIRQFSDGYYNATRQ